MVAQAPFDMSSNAATLRPRGIFRYFEAAFLGVWLTGWLIGETLAIGALASLLLSFSGFFSDSRWMEFGRSAAQAGAAFVLVFLTVWLACWTVGGVLAWRKLLRDLSGADCIRLAAPGLELTRRAGPFARTLQFDRAHMRRIRIRSHDKALVVDTIAGTQVLTDLGTASERESLCAWLRHRLSMDGAPAASLDASTAPPGWRLERHESGALRLTRPTGGRTIVGVIMWLMTGAVLYTWIREVPDDGARIAWQLLLIALLAFAAAWVMWAREEWIVRRGHLEYHLQFGPLLRERRFDDGQLEVTHTKDSDGDSRYRLIVRDASKNRTFDSSLYDDAELVDCARWLEASTGFPLRLPR
jgi:hypothetical protein